MPQFIQVTTSGGNGVPQRRQRCAGGPPNGGYTDDIYDTSVKGYNSVGKVSHIILHMSITCQEHSIFGLHVAISVMHLDCFLAGHRVSNHSEIRQRRE